MKKIIIFFLLSIFPFINNMAQDAYLANQYANPIYLNPAYSGGSTGPSVFMNYRDQWPGITGTFITSMISVDIPIDKISGGFGAIFSNESKGRRHININTYGLSYAHSFRLSENFSIRAGVQGDYIRKRINWERIPMCCFGPCIDYNELKDIDMADFTGGVLASGKKFNFSPLLLFMKQQQFSQASVGCYINRESFSIGAVYQVDDAFIFSAGLRDKHFRFGYSYDLTISKLGMQTLGSHEIFLVGVLSSKKERKKLQPANMPVF